MRQATANKRVRALLTAMQGHPLYATEIMDITGTSSARCHEALTAAHSTDILTGTPLRRGFVIPEKVGDEVRIYARTNLRRTPR